jgi:hypothetical protein
MQLCEKVRTNKEGEVRASFVSCCGLPLFLPRGNNRKEQLPGWHQVMTQCLLTIAKCEVQFLKMSKSDSVLKVLKTQNKNRCLRTHSDIYHVQHLPSMLISHMNMTWTTATQLRRSCRCEAWPSSKTNHNVRAAQWFVLFTMKLLLSTHRSISVSFPI